MTRPVKNPIFVPPILNRNTLAIFSGFRRFTDAIAALVDQLADLVAVLREAGPATDRLEALELSRHQFEAECAGALLEAKGKLRGALSSEARERQMKKSYETNAEDFVETGDAGSGKSPILPDDVEASEAERVSALRLDVAPGNKTAALAHKFGR